MIPKRAYFYLGYEKLSWLRYLTIYSFIKQNPDWKVVVCRSLDTIYKGPNTWNTPEQTEKYNGKCYWSELKKYFPKTISYTHIDFKGLGFENDMPEVYKADIWRNYAINFFGGYVLATDVLWKKPLEVLDEYDTVVCYNTEKSYYSLGIIGGEQGNSFYGSLFEKCKNKYNYGGYNTSYQSFGSELINGKSLDDLKDMFPDCNFFNHPFNWLYEFDSTRIPEIYSDSKLKLCPEAIGLHWYGGHKTSGTFENLLTPENYKDFPNLLTTLISEVLGVQKIKV